MSSASSHGFIHDHFPANHAALSKIFGGLAAFALALTLGVMAIRDYLVKTGR